MLERIRNSFAALAWRRSRVRVSSGPLQNRGLQNKPAASAGPRLQDSFLDFIRFGVLPGYVGASRGLEILTYYRTRRPPDSGPLDSSRIIPSSSSFHRGFIATCFTAGRLQTVESTEEVSSMPIFPPIPVRQPRPHDLVDDPVGVCGVGTGFEGVISARVRDNNGRELRQTSIRAGGTGIWGNFQVRIDLPDRLPTARGTLEVFEEAQDGSGRELNKVVVPIVFGPALVDPSHGFAQYTVESGDPLSSIAEQFLGDADRWRAIFQANRDQIEDPDVIFPGQVLRIPQ